MKADNKKSNIGMQGGDNYGTVVNNFNFKLPSFRKIKISLLIFLIPILAFITPYLLSIPDDRGDFQSKGESRNTTTIMTEKAKIQSPPKKSNTFLEREQQQVAVIRNSDLKKNLVFSESLKKNSISQNTVESFLNDFISKDNFYKLLIVKLVDYRVLLDEKTANQALEVNFEVGINYPLYEKKVAELESYFSEIGAKLESKTDYPVPWSR